ncbi:MAG TPA: PAS domain S-box protein [Aliidongia sp.]|uniref:PAS domain-containing protein n=1 Tax=Aliidongia sp. TaxID=1914230 RepID=UPI002DDCA593|nr:PAS domain S-box protein [Aliidongia sp.]HEV2676581.1 PAS domain S-box protein [Aliidongia sp.]
MADKALPDKELLSILQAFVGKAKETILITDADLNVPGGPMILHANDAVESSSGYTARDLIGQRLGILYPAESLPGLIAQLRDAAQSGQPIQIEALATSKAGKPHWMEVSTIAILSPAGVITHFVRMGRDVTARKRAESERETTQRLLASVFGVLDQALGVIDDHGRFAMVNTAVTRQFGWSVFDLIGKPYTEIIDPAERPTVERQLATGDEMTCRMSVRLRHRKGDLLPGEIVVTTIPQPDGRPYRVMMVTQRADMPVDKSFEQAVRKALQGVGKSGTVVAGKVQLVGLAEVRAALGDRWPAVADRSFQAAENILRKHLGDTDVFSRTADDGFLVCFAELDESEAQFKARTIGNEIREKLVGEFPEMAGTDVTSFATTIQVDADDMMPENAIVNALEARLTRERKRLEDAAIKAMRAKLTTAEVWFQIVRTDTNHAAPIVLTRLPADIEDAQSTLLALGRSEYVPQTELLLLTGAAERVLAELKQDRTDLILTPVRLATLTHRRDAEHWLQVARTLGGPGKKRLVVEIRELGRDTARARLTDVTMMVSSLFRAVAFELPTTDPAFIAHLPITAPLVTIEARLLGDNATVPVTRLLKTLLPRRCRLIVKNVASSTLAVTLAKAGVPLIATNTPD